MNGTSRILASVCASSVLPHPVGPISSILDFEATGSISLNSNSNTISNIINKCPGNPQLHLESTNTASGTIVIGNYKTKGQGNIVASVQYPPQLSSNSSTIDGITYTSSNNAATHTLTNAIGCDSVVTLDLTINYSTTGTDVITACDSYTWIDGITYTSSNNAATHTLTNTLGCDSIVTLDLTINYTTREII